MIVLFIGGTGTISSACSQLAVIKAHSGHLIRVAFSPDGRRLATGSIDLAARISNWKPTEPIAKACVHLPSNLTRKEWQRYIGAEPYYSTCPNLPTPEK